MIANYKKNGSGFTLIELMLAMAFITFLLLFIVSAIIQVTRIYNKGLSIRQINQAGRQFNEDITRAARYAVKDSIKSPAGRQRLCIDGTTYVWNLETTTGLTIVNSYQGAPAGTDPIRLIKVTDSGGLLCNSPYPNVPFSSATDLLGPQLGVRRMSITSRENGRIWVISNVISTIGGSRPLGPGRPTPTGFECPANGDGAFCAFGSFETTVYVRNWL